MPTGSVAGAVRDQAGAAIAAAHVRLKNAATGLIREVTTSTEGDYSFPALPAGEYEVSVEATGFRNIRRTASVEAGSSTAADFVLGVGEAKDSVTVDGASPEVNYDSHAVGGVINSSQIQELPLNSRTFLELAKLEPGVQPPARASNNRLLVTVLGAPGGQSGRGTRVTANGMTGRTADPEAYNLYLQGLFFLHQRPESTPVQKKAIGYFDQAIAKDPSFALAFAGLSDAWFNLVKNESRNAEAIPAAEAAARRALQLDETLSEAHVSLANVLVSRRDWSAADKEYKRAIELNPRNTKAHVDYASVDLALTDRLDLAIQEMERAQALDPVGVDTYGLDSLLLLCARRYDESIAEARKALELNPRSIGVQNMLGRAYVQKGMLPEAAAEFAKAEGMGVRRAHWAASLAELYVKSGRRPEAEKMLATWSKRPREEFGHAESMSMIYASRGRKDEAFQWLDEAYRENWGRLPWIKISPEYDSLRDDPRFSALLNKMGLN